MRRINHDAYLLIQEAMLMKGLEIMMRQRVHSTSVMAGKGAK